MRTRTEIRPTGTNAQTDYTHQQGRQVHDELQMFDSQTVKFERTTRGWRAHSKIPPPKNKKVPYCGDGPPSATTLSGSFSAKPNPDLYVDMVGFGLYVCITAGSDQVGQSGGSVWHQLTGVGGSFSFYSELLTYKAGQTVQVLAQKTILGVTIVPGTYGCMVDTNQIFPAGIPSGDTNQLPQFPYPTSGIVYWMLLSLGPNVVNVCSDGNKQVYINSSSTF